ncbi:hypothetical protein B0F90DRAFT_1720369, partial [Multifurca ochricompacta]
MSNSVYAMHRSSGLNSESWVAPPHPTHDLEGLRKGSGSGWSSRLNQSPTTTRIIPSYITPSFLIPQTRILHFGVCKGDDIISALPRAYLQLNFRFVQFASHPAATLNSPLAMYFSFFFLLILVFFFLARRGGTPYHTHSHITWLVSRVAHTC